MQRRTFIAGALMTALGTDQAPQKGRLGMADVDRIQGTITRLDAHFNGLGGGALYEVAVDYLARLQRALDRCVYGERVERALMRSVADVAACAGWSAHDCGDYARAAQLRNEALQAALLARDPVAVTRAWSDLAAQSAHAGRPAEAARINRAALTERHLRTQPLISALLHARLAECLAQTGDRSGMGRQLAAAERVYDRAEPEGAASWLAFLTAGRTVRARGDRPPERRPVRPRRTEDDTDPRTPRRPVHPEPGLLRRAARRTPARARRPRTSCGDGRRRAHVRGGEQPYHRPS